jgi:lipid-A-disaccharide synthase
LETPQVVCYGFHPLTFAIARLTVHVKYISLANLALDRLVVPELIQADATPQRMFEELERLLWDEASRSRMAADYAELKQVLGDADASAGVAKDIYETFARI